MDKIIENITPIVAKEFKIGAILVSQWGYEQTNVNYYVIVAMSKKFASVIPMSSKIERSINAMTTLKVPNIIKNKEEIIRRKINLNQKTGIQHIVLESFEDAYLWDGLPMEATSSY